MVLNSQIDTRPDAASAWKALLPYLDRSCDAPATANVLAVKNTSISFIENGGIRWVSAFIRRLGCWLAARILVNREKSANQSSLPMSIFLYTHHSAFELGVVGNLKSNQSLDARS